MIRPEKDAAAPAPAKALVVLVAGRPVPTAEAAHGDFLRMIRQVAGEAWIGRWLAIDLPGEDPLLDPSQLAGAIITGSPAHLRERAAWMQRGLAYLRDLHAAQVPMLGICFGHQMLGEVLGGKVAANPRGREIGTVDLRVQHADPLLASGNGRFPVNTSHLDSVVELPHGARILATTERELHAAVRYDERTWGVQFHPEMDGSILRHYLQARRDALRAEGTDPDDLVRAASDTIEASHVVPRFIRHALVC